MKLVGFRMWSVRIPLRAPLATAHGAIRQRCGVVLALEATGGINGWGECLPLPGFGLETEREARHALHSVAPLMLGRSLDTPACLLHEIAPLVAGAPGAKAAVDLAVHDLAAQRDGVSLATWLASREGATPRREVRLSALLGADEPGALAQAAAAAAARGFRCLKLKVGCGDFARDLARVAAVREAVSPAARLRLDANRAWRPSEARERLEALARFGIEFVEEPLHAPDVATLAQLRARTPIPIAVDETLSSEDRGRRLLDAGACDVLVLKPAAVGGLRPARRIAALAHTAKVPVAVTSFLDTSLGRGAALQLAAAMPSATLDAGLATGALLSREPVALPLPSEPRLPVPTQAGLGFAPDPASLEACATSPVWEIHS